ncbi:MAG: hypothetical protein J6J04_06220 [Oscillospiraceae bacterium]|nr:hypothetical protein [Oscillospiraceae bacterium]
MDLDEIRSDLEERFPQWTNRIRLLRFQSAAGANPVDNDGSIIYYNDHIMSRYSRERRCFYMAQQLLHIQLAHNARGAGRDRVLWKQASDAVVNAMLREDGFQVPEDIMLIRDAANQSTEELYEALFALGEQENSPHPQEDAVYVEAEPVSLVKEAGDKTKAKEISLDDPGLASAVAGLAEMLEPSLQMDFDWFPGTTIRDGMLRYDFRAYPVSHAEILLDTSASVDADLLRYFVRAVKALLREDAVVRVGCFDTRFYGFQDVSTEEDIEKLELRGAGGTDFTVAVNAFTGDAENQIIFTDGYAEMPEEQCNAIWVVYGSMPIHPKGGRVIYVKPTEEKEKHEIDFLIT